MVPVVRYFTIDIYLFLFCEICEHRVFLVVRYKHTRTCTIDNYLNPEEVDIWTCDESSDVQ